MVFRRYRVEQRMTDEGAADAGTSIEIRLKREYHHDVVDPFSYDERLNPGFGETVKRFMARRMPAMAEASTLYGYACLYDLSPDAHPILGGVEGYDNLHLMLGFSGAGFKKGPATGQALAELIVHGKASFVDLTPFRLSRFQDEAWRAPWSPDEYSFSTDFGHKF